MEHLITNSLPKAAIKARIWFVQQDNGRFWGKRTSQCYTLLLTAR